MDFPEIQTEDTRPDIPVPPPSTLGTPSWMQLAALSVEELSVLED